VLTQEREMLIGFFILIAVRDSSWHSAQANLCTLSFTGFFAPASCVPQ